VSNHIQALVAELARLPGVAEVVVSDDSGGYVAGINNPDPDQFAAVVAFTGRSAMTTGEILAMEELRFLSLLGRKNKMLIFNLSPYMVGLRLDENAIVSKIETRISEILPTSVEELEELEA